MHLSDALRQTAWIKFLMYTMSTVDGDARDGDARAPRCSGCFCTDATIDPLVIDVLHQPISPASIRSTASVDSRNECRCVCNHAVIAEGG